MDGLLLKYFVLNPKGDTEYHRASREAMRTYAKCIYGTNPELAQDLEKWIEALN